MEDRTRRPRIAHEGSSDESPSCWHCFSHPIARFQKTGEVALGILCGGRRREVPSHSGASHRLPWLVGSLARASLSLAMFAGGGLLPRSASCARLSSAWPAVEFARECVWMSPMGSWLKACPGQNFHAWQRRGEGVRMLVHETQGPNKDPEGGILSFLLVWVCSGMDGLDYTQQRNI